MLVGLLPGGAQMAVAQDRDPDLAMLEATLEEYGVARNHVER